MIPKTHMAMKSKTRLSIELRGFTHFEAAGETERDRAMEMILSFLCRHPKFDTRSGHGLFIHGQGLCISGLSCQDILNFNLDK